MQKPGFGTFSSILILIFCPGRRRFCWEDGKYRSVFKNYSYGHHAHL